MYVGMNGLRTVRLKLIFKGEQTFFHYYPINSYHTAFNRIIPYRLGELTLLHFMKRNNIPLKTSFAALLFMKGVDFIFSGLYFLLIFLLIVPMLINPVLYLIGVVIVFIISVGTFGFLIFINRIPRWVAYFHAKIPIKFIQSILTFLSETAENIILFKQDNKLSCIIFISGIIRLIQLAETVVIFIALNISFPTLLIVLNDLFLGFAELIPLSILANFGYYELTFSILIESQREAYWIPNAYNFAIFWHLIALGFMLLNLLFGLGIDFILKLKRKRNRFNVGN
jgi:uncharacterized protein (TIRG00374 family)